MDAPKSALDPGSLGLGTLSLVLDGPVARATFERPQQLNSISEAVLDDLDSVIATVRDVPAVRALVLRGTGDVFSVGLDLELLDRAFGDVDYFEHVLTRLATTCLSLEELEVPVVAAVNGLARAGGFELALACDFVVAAESARIGDVHTSFGVVPGGGSSVRLPRLVGPQRAKEIFFSARWLNGREAVELGLALRAVPAEQLDVAVDELLAGMVDKSRPCLGTVKRQMRRTVGLSTADGVAVEREEFLSYLRTPGSDGVEGFRAYQQGRPPSWARA